MFHIFNTLTMTKIIILDDEKHCTDILSALLEKIPGDNELVGVFNDPHDALDFLKDNEVDILFLDIEMPVMNGFKLLDKISPIKFDVIFTTAYDEYAIKAFEYSAMNYLLKPIAGEAIAKALSLREERTNKISTEQWNMLQTFLDDTETAQNKLALPTGQGYEIIEVKNIVRCLSENNYTYFYFEDGSKILVSRTLKKVEEILSEQGFLRVHQSHLINPKFVKTVSKQDGGILFMLDGSKVPVSRQKKSHLDNILETVLRFD